MSIKDMPCVTVEQVTRLREQAIKNEEELILLKQKINELPVIAIVEEDNVEMQGVSVYLGTKLYALKGIKNESN
jgi:hypothetical protein